MKKKEHSSFSVEGIHYATGSPTRIEVSDGIIQDIKETAKIAFDSRSLYISQGLIDNQINGYASTDFSGDSLSAGEVLTAAEAVWRGGVTTFLPTLISNSHENLLRNFGILRQALLNTEILRDSIPGFHLEGPYISPEDGFRGCHPAHYIRRPSFAEFREYQEASGGKIIQVTVAPEIEGAMDFIKSCIGENVLVSIGHTNASASQIGMAADCGVRLSTHLGNGCANMIHRHRNPIWQQLADDRLMPSIIADGHHLLPEELKVIYKVKGPGNLILTSDVIYLAGMAPGKYSFLGAEVLLTPEGMLLDVKQDCLAGASFPLIKGVGNMMNLVGCSLKEAVDMASVNVARAYNLSDRGSLSPGKRADIILFEKTGNLIKIKKTWLNGVLVHED